MAGDQQKVLVAGAGGMGALFGAILQDGGLDVTLFDTNPDHVNAIRNDGLAILGLGGDRVVRIAATLDAADIAEADIILFQCKAHGTRAAAQSVRHLVDKGAVCISFQNGLGNEEVIGEVVGPENVLGGLTAMAGQIIKPGTIRDFDRVPTYLGEMQGGLSPRASRLAEILSNAGLETRASGDIRREIWKKLLGNIAGSALSGTTNLTAADCLAVPALKETSYRALDEALAVARSIGYEFDRADVVRGLEMITKPGGTGDNKSSLCVDIVNRRPTEVEFIYGTVIARADENGVAVPTLKTLASIVKGLESGYLDGKPKTGSAS